MKNLFVVIVLMFVAVSFIGCVTVADDIPLYIETPGTPYKLVTKYSENTTGGKVVSSTTDQEETVATLPMLEYELKIKALEVKLEAAKASASYRSTSSNWYGGGGVVITGSGGHNRYYSNGGGTSSGTTGGVTITTGSGGSSQVVNNPSGPNTSGANSPGGVVVIGPGGSNTNYHH